MDGPGPERSGVRPLPGGGRPSLDALWTALEQAQDRQAFLRAWAGLLFARVGARKGLVLLGAPDTGPFSPVVAWPEGGAALRTLSGMAERAIRERCAQAEALAEQPAGDSPRSLDGCAVAHPVIVDGRLHGAIVVEVAPRASDALREVSRELRWSSGWLVDHVRAEGSVQESRHRSRLGSVIDALAAVVEEERFQGACTALVTDLVARFGAERASVGFVARGRVQLQGLSHSASFAKRTALVRDLEAAMDEAVDQGATLTWPAIEGAPERPVRAQAALAERHDLTSVLSIPLPAGDRSCGAVTLERRGAPFDTAAVEELEAVASLVGPMLEARRRDERSLAAKAIDSARTSLRALVGPRHVARKLVVAALVLVVAFLAVAKGDYRVSADTVLEPAVLRAAVAPFAGYVARAPARAGDVVAEGALLATLDDRDLVLERLKWASEHEKLAKQHREALAERDASRAEIVGAQIAQARAELDRIEDRLTRTALRAPFEGVVVSGDWSQKLGAPVETGDLLFEVAPLDAYRVIVRVDERDVADVREGQTGRLMLTALPDRSFPITVETVTPVASAVEGRNVFRVEARFEGEPPRLRPGMEGVAKIDVDRRRLAWIWAHDAIDWLRLFVWTWTP